VVARARNSSSSAVTSFPSADEIPFDRQRGSTAKAVYSLERSCPSISVAPVLAIARMVAALSLQRESMTPLERLLEFRRPGRVALIPNNED
jgi:hypothetical protein